MTAKGTSISLLLRSHRTPDGLRGGWGRSCRRSLRLATWTDGVEDVAFVGGDDHRAGRFAVQRADLPGGAIR